MIWELLFVGIGICGIYFLYNLMKKDALEGKCGGCSSSKSCSKKTCK